MENMVRQFICDYNSLGLGMPKTISFDECEVVAALKMEAQKDMRQGAYKSAGLKFRELNLLCPEDAFPYQGLAMVFVMEGRLDEALQVQKRAVKLAPEKTIYAFNLFKIFLLKEDYVDALSQFEKIANKIPVQYKEELEYLVAFLNARLNEKEFRAKEAVDPKMQIKEPGKIPVKRFLNLLFVQQSPCIRNYKTAQALRSRGHKVSLAYTKTTLSKMYKGLSDEVYNQCIQMKSYKDLWDISGGFDLIHCHNEPDKLTVVALAGNAPVVHDTHDLISLRTGGDESLAFFEGVANRGAHGRIYTTPYQRDVAKKAYGVEGPCLVFYNYTSASDLPKKKLDKLSARDGKYHLVYEGGLSDNGHRDFRHLFNELAGLGIHVHILPSNYNRKVKSYFQNNSLIHYYAPLSPKNIMEEMTCFDAGIIPFNLEKGNRAFLESTIANKLFEYLAAGLPVLTSDLKSYRDYFRVNNVGSVFKTADEIVQKLPGLISMAQNKDLTCYAKTYESEIGRLEYFYHNIIENFGKRLSNSDLQI